MLSSLGSCRDRSPVGDQPPSKIFVQYQEAEEESKTEKLSSQPISASGAPSQTEPQPAVRAKVPVPSQKPSGVPSQAVDLKSQPYSQPVPMIVVQDFEEENRSPQPQMHPCEQVKDSQSVEQVKGSQSIEVKAQKCVQAQAKIKEHHVESQTSLPQSETQKQTDNQWKMQAPIASHPSHNLQKAASQVLNEQQLETQPHVHIQKQETTQLTKQQKVQAQTAIQSQPQGQLETQSQKDITCQHQAPKQKRKAKKSQANLQNRPWLQQRSQLENVTQKPAQLVPQSQSEPEDKGQISPQAPPQHIVAVSSPEAQGPVHGMVTTQSKSIVESGEKRMKQAQPFAQEEPLIVTQKLPLTVPAVAAQPVIQKQPQQCVSPPISQQVLTQHPPQPYISTQAQATTQYSQATAPIQQQKQPQTPILTPQQPQVITLKQAQPQSMTPMQPQWQPLQTFPQSHPALPQPQRFPVTQTMPQGISSPGQQYPTYPIQPQVIMQRQQSPHSVVQTQQPTLHNPTAISPQNKGASSIQPRIISMPRPQMPVQSQSQTQVEAQGSAPLMIQPHGQPQWYQPGDVSQTYPKVHGPISVAAQMQPLAHFQTHPQPQSVPPSQPKQWSTIRPGIVPQTYPPVEFPGQKVQTQSQMAVYPKTQPQPQPQQWPPARPVSPWDPSQIRPQHPAQQMVPSQQWRPVSPERVSPVCPKVESQGHGPYPQPQSQALTRSQSPQRQWGPVRPEHQFQVSSQTMSHSVLQPVAPWNQPPAQTPIRSQSPQQPQQSQQKCGSSRIEAPSETLIQSQAAQTEPQSQDLTKPQLPVQEPPQQQSAPRVKQPALAQAPPKAYTEAYIKAQALVRNRFEEAKHCLQEHILEAINVFKDKRVTDEQASVKEVCPFYT